MVALAATAAVVPPPAAQAHDSSYCLHGRDGYWTVTVFRTHYWSEGRHVHIYDHYDWAGRWLHWQRKLCP